MGSNGIKAAFDMEGEFEATGIPCSCNCGEYRQTVKGAQYTGDSADTMAPYHSPHDCVYVDPAVAQEDCANYGGKQFRYGHRASPFANSQFVDAAGAQDQMYGCKFVGWDEPFIQGKPGQWISMNLEFRGRLIDTCNDNRVLDSSQWTVAGMRKLP